MNLKNKVMVRYGKSSEDFLPHKKSFFVENNRLLTKGVKINKLYASQPKRNKCKNCNYILGEPKFKKLHVCYCFCERCGHLNGMSEDTADFCNSVYTDDRGVSYAELYSSKSIDSFNERTRDIYVPKAEFLKDALIYADVQPATLRYADIGAGTGYFVAAMKKIGLVDSVGYEVSDQQIEVGNSMIGSSALNKLEIDKTPELIESLEADVISMIGVLEHLQHPRLVLSALKDNKKLKFFFISVPLFSISVFFEMVFPNVFNRQLSGAHTHLYTETSLKYMAKEFNLELVASWWFGTDMMDLHRSLSTSIRQNSDISKMTSMWNDLFTPLLDNLQLQLDEKHFSSEVHMLYAVHGEK